MRTSPVFPPERLPPGFLATLQNPPDPPVTPRPSATLVPLRSGPSGLEVLLLQRSPRSGFIPGAWVFPGGTVDEEDGSEAVRSCLVPGSPGGSSSGHPKPFPSGPLPSSGPTGDLHPPLPFWIAALRETFEETGILLQAPDQKPVPKEKLTRARTALLAGETTLHGILADLGTQIDLGQLAYTAHWVTPECEPRRYETRFFMADVGTDARAVPHEMEMVDAVWLHPAQALERNLTGTLPMVYPTVSALEELTPFTTPAEALAGLMGKNISRCLPVPEQTPAGVRFLLP